MPSKPEPRWDVPASQIDWTAKATDIFALLIDGKDYRDNNIAIIAAALRMHYSHGLLDGMKRADRIMESAIKEALERERSYGRKN